MLLARLAIGTSNTLAVMLPLEFPCKASMHPRHLSSLTRYLYWGYRLDSPLSKEQGPGGPGRGGLLLLLAAAGTLGSDTLRRASHVSSPSVSRTYSSTFVALTLRSLSTSVAVCRHLGATEEILSFFWRETYMSARGQPIGCCCKQLALWVGQR